MWDRVAVLHSVSLRYAVFVAVRFGHALHLADDLVDSDKLVFPIRDELECLVGQRVRLAVVIVVSVVEFLWHRVSFLHCFVLWLALRVAVRIGHALAVADDVDHGVVLTDCFSVILLDILGPWQRVRQSIGLIDTVSIVIAERVRDRVSHLHGVALQLAILVAVRFGNVLYIAVELDGLFELADRDDVLQRVGNELQQRDAQPVGLDIVVTVGVGERVRDRICLGHGLHFADNFDNCVVLANCVSVLLPNSNGSEECNREFVGRADDIADNVCDFVRNRLALLHCVDVRLAVVVSVRFGFALYLAVDLGDSVELIDVIGL